MRSAVPRVGCAILAAGAGRRFGTPGEKLIAVVRGKALLQHAVDAACASSATRCSIVLGAAAERVLAAVDARRCAVYLNSGWGEGIASSIRCAIAAHADDDACILMLADHPHAASVDVSALVAAFSAQPNRIVALQRGAVWGAPMLFPRRDFPALLRLRGDRGAKRYAESRRSRVAFVESMERHAFADVDRRRDLHASAR